MDVSISKRVMPLFGLLCAGALMCASALFFARMSLWRSPPRRAAVPAFIFCRLNTWMRFLSRAMDTLGWSIPTAQWRLVGAKSMASGISSITAERCRRAGTTDGSSWYWFGSDGAMATGWRSIAGSWYYFDDSGVMKANCWMGDYCFLPNRAMATNTVIGGYRIGPDGKWIP